MNYTENYHLPQWVRDDRIMMEDFNQMCADIESGLCKTSQEAKNVHRDSGVLEVKTWNRISRLAYNHYCTVQAMTSAPHQVGLFQQNASSDAGGISGAAMWEGLCCAGKNVTTLTADMLRDNIQNLTGLQVIKDNLAACTPLTAQIHVPATGKLRAFALGGSYSNAVANESLRCQLTLRNQNSGVVEQSQVIEMKFVAEGAVFNQQISVPLLLLGEADYLVTIQPLTANCTLTANFGLHTNSRVDAGRFASDAISAAYQFQEQAPGEGGIAVIRCVLAGENAKLTFWWDGVERMPDMVRTVCADGRGWQEFIFLRDDAIPQDSSMSLRLESGDNGTVALSDWGAMLL